MADIRRYFELNVPYFITTVTKDRMPLFKDHKLCRILMITIEYYKIIFNFTIQAYCIMPDHVHLILTASGEYDLSFIMKMIKGSFARKVNKISKKEGPLWQRRFYDEAIRNEKQLLQQLEYIHQNPVKAGLTTNMGDYIFSSYNYYHDSSRFQNALEIEEHTKVGNV